MLKTLTIKETYTHKNKTKQEKRNNPQKQEMIREAIKQQILKIYSIKVLTAFLSCTPNTLNQLYYNCSPFLILEYFPLLQLFNYSIYFHETFLCC